MYKKLDLLLTKLLKNNQALFLQTKATTKFDEVNVLKKSKKLYEQLAKQNVQAYMQLAEYGYLKGLQMLGIENPKDNPPSKLWLLALLGAFNATSEYVYDHEVDRKRARFYESVIASNGSLEAYRKALKVWNRQTTQYGIEVTDKACLKAYEDNGVKKIRWFTQEDEKVCSVCRERNGKIYPINEIPEKHYYCRCYYEPIKESEESEDKE